MSSLKDSQYAFWNLLVVLLYNVWNLSVVDGAWADIMDSNDEMYVSVIAYIECN